MFASVKKHTGETAHPKSMAADGSYYLVPLTAGLNENDETAYSIGKITKRRAPTGTGSSSPKGGAQRGGNSSAGTIYTSEDKSQEVKTDIIYSPNTFFTRAAYSCQASYCESSERASAMLR